MVPSQKALPSNCNQDHLQLQPCERAPSVRNLSGMNRRKKSLSLSLFSLLKWVTSDSPTDPPNRITLHPTNLNSVWPFHLAQEYKWWMVANKDMKTMFECQYGMVGTWNRYTVLHTLSACLLFHSVHSLNKCLFSMFHGLEAQQCTWQRISTRLFQCRGIITSLGGLGSESCKCREPRGNDR